MEKTFESAEILKAEDLYELQDLDCFDYRMTKDEIQWLNFIAGKYSIADYIENNLTEDVLFIDKIEISEAMDDDCRGCGKAVMLSDDSALQKILFWIYIETN